MSPALSVISIAIISKVVISNVFISIVTLSNLPWLIDIATIIGNNYLRNYIAQGAKVSTQGDTTSKTRPKRKCK